MGVLNDDLKIDNPCPSILLRMQKCGDNYFCKSCDKTIVDFRNYSSDEIKNPKYKGVCGIYKVDQLSGQQKMSMFKRVLFYGLTFLAFFGFSVKPLKAQTTINKIDSLSADKLTKNKDIQKSTTNGDEKVESTNKRKRLFRRKKKSIVVGYR